MSFGKNDGPTRIPAHTRHVAERVTCFGCRHFDSHVEGNVCGGFGARLGSTVTTCSHPDAMHYYEGAESSGQLALRTPDRGRPREIGRGEMMSRADGTPDWCPYLREKRV